MSCVCCERPNTNAEVTLKGHAAAADEVQCPRVPIEDGTVEPTVEGKLEQQVEESQISYRSEPSLSPEEKEKEKQRLGNLVKHFVQEAMQGVSCIIVDPQTSDRSSVNYSIDSSLQEIKFSLEPPVIFDLKHMEEVILCPEKEKGMPAGLKLEDSEVNRALYARSKDRELHILFDTENRAELFSTCAKILHLYCQTPTPKQGAPISPSSKTDEL